MPNNNTNIINTCNTHTHTHTHTNENITTLNAINNYAIYLSGKVCSSTISTYLSHLKRFDRYCKNEFNVYDVDAVTKEMIEKYLMDLWSNGKFCVCINEYYTDDVLRARKDYKKLFCVTTINSYIHILKMFFNWLCCCCMIKNNPMSEIEKIRKNNTKNNGESNNMKKTNIKNTNEATNAMANTDSNVINNEIFGKFERLQYAKKAVLSTLENDGCMVDFHGISYWANEVERLRKEIKEML